MQSNDLFTNVFYVTNNVKQCENVNFRDKQKYFVLYIFWVINKNWIIRLFCYSYCFLPSIYMYNICDILYDSGAFKKLNSCRKVKVIINVRRNCFDNMQKIQNYRFISPPSSHLLKPFQCVENHLWLIMKAYMALLFFIKIMINIL